MERTPKRSETIEFERDVLVIGQCYQVRAFKHGGRVRLEVAHLHGPPVVTKLIDIPRQNGKNADTA